MNTSMLTTKQYDAAVAAALPVILKREGATTKPQTAAESRKMHAAITSARALASTIASGYKPRNPNRDEVRAALRACGLTISDLR